MVRAVGTPASPGTRASFATATLLERLEANRVHHLATVWESQTREGRQRGVLDRLLESSAFAVAERLSRLRVKAGVAPAQSVISKDEIRRVLGR